MPITAYSTKFEREIDTYQLLSLLGHDITIDPILKNISQSDRLFISKDIRCPSCGVAGAHIVSGAQSKKSKHNIRQPHYRFLFPDGSDGHDKFCDFSEDPAIKNKSDLLIDFSKPNTELTQYIASMVCKAIDHKILSQQDIRDLRQWHFDKKKSTLVDISIDIEQIEVFQFLSHHIDSKKLHFKAEFGELQNFSWEIYARNRFVHKESDLIKKIATHVGKNFEVVDLEKIKRVLSKIDRKTFDLRVFEKEYNLVQELRRFVLVNDIGYFRLGKSKKNGHYLDAFCALLLNINDWNFEKAISYYINISKLPNAEDKNLGKVIGLAPFNDFKVYKIILDANDLSKELKAIGDNSKRIGIEENILKEEYQVWSESRKLSK